MTSFSIACQSITFGPEQKTFLPKVVQSVAASGFDGLEIGFRHVNQTPAEEFRGLLDSHGLKLAALHIGGNLEDPSQAAGERSVLDDVLDYLQKTGAKQLLYSGMRDPDSVKEELSMLNRAAENCARNRIQLMYHNHHWEFKDGASIINYLFEESSPQLGFCPDLGWVKKAGADPVEFLREHHARIKAIHLKDFASLSDEVDTVELGEGVVPLSECAEVLQQLFDPIWVTAEQDTSEIPAEEAIAKNAAFCKKHFKKD
jgi:sugar phosphate isomerase/epimerase